MKFQSDAQKGSYDDFLKVTCLECNSEVCKNPNFLRSYLQKYSDIISEIQIQGLEQFLLKLIVFLDSETS